MKRHWYFIYIDYCPVCGRSDVTRERRYTRRPKRWWSRHEVVESACSGHFI